MQTETPPVNAPALQTLEVSKTALPANVVWEPAPPPRTGRRRWFWLAALGAALGLAVWMGGQYWLRPPVVAIVHPARGVAINAVYATGIIEAIDYARVSATVAGRVVELAVAEGDKVQSGQRLARLDDRQSRARLSDARARLTLAEAEIHRAETLLNRGVAALQSLERAQAERDQAAASVELAVRQLEDYDIVAPLDGIVMKRDVELGETAAANAVMFEISSTKRLRIAAEVDERDIADVRLGAALAARADGFPDRTFQAAVTNIRRQGDTGSRTFRVEADLPTDTVLLIGMTVDVDIVTGERDDALLVPASAVGHEASKGGSPGPAYVFGVEQGRVRKVAVATGAVGRDRIEIVAGLSENDAVIVEPGDRLRDGQAVSVSR